MCESKGPVPNVLKGGALGWELLCLFWKRIMSSSQCQGYYIYKALQFFGWYSKCYARFTYVFSLTSRRGKKPSSNGSVSGKGSWPVHSSHSSFPAPPNATHIATLSDRGAGEVCKLTQEKGGKSWEVGWDLRSRWKGGLPGWEGKPQCHSINMTLNKRRFKFLNRKQKENNPMWFHSECFQKVCDAVILHLRRLVPKQRSYRFSMQQQKKEITAVSQMIYNNAKEHNSVLFQGVIVVRDWA